MTTTPPDTKRPERVERWIFRKREAMRPNSDEYIDCHATCLYLESLEKENKKLADACLNYKEWLDGYEKDIEKLKMDTSRLNEEIARRLKAEADLQKAFEYAADWGLNASGFLKRVPNVTPQESIKINIREEFERWQKSREGK